MSYKIRTVIKLIDEKYSKNIMLFYCYCHYILYSKAQNPIIQTKYTADPAPLVYHDTVFLYTRHDEDAACGFIMRDWLRYTSTDMVNWTDHGTVASLKDFKWGTL